MEQYLTVQEVAELARCEHKAVRRAIRQGTLRAFRPTKRLLIREDDATAWIEGRLAADYEPAIAAPPRPTRVTWSPGIRERHTVGA